MKSTAIYFIYLSSIFLGHAAFAQVNDTSVFFRYAATFDYLLPINGEPYTLALPDSAALKIFNYQPKNERVLKIVSATEVNETGEKHREVLWERIEWDAEGRLERLASYNPNDTASYSDTRIKYLIGSKISYVTVRNQRESFSPDTLMYTYNRSGWISNWRKHEFTYDTEVTAAGNRMYDSRGRLIVATYMMYGPLLGAYTYEYNQKNQLIRRCFTTVSGAILCTDTIEYSEQSQLSSIEVVTHKLKIGGSSEWKTLESKTVYPFSGKILTYSDYNDADTNYYYKNLPSYTVTFEYDDKGRVVSENFGNQITPSMITSKYEYGKYDQPDVIEYSETISAKKSTLTRVYSRDVRRYDDKGRIEEREITTFLFEEMKKKSTFVPKEIVEIRYQWL